MCIYSEAGGLLSICIVNFRSVELNYQVNLRPGVFGYRPTSTSSASVRSRLSPGLESRGVSRSATATAASTTAPTDLYQRKREVVVNS